MAPNSANRKPPVRKRRHFETHGNVQAVPESLLVLENPPSGASSKDNKASIVDDDKVINYLLKIGAASDSKSGVVLFKLPLGPSEALFLEYEEGLLERIKVSFHLKDIAIGSLPRSLSIQGESSGVAGAAVYASFVLITRANNTTKTQTYTLKSSNYSLTALLRGSESDISRTAEEQGLASFDVHSSESGLRFWLRGDLSTLFKFVRAVITLPSIGTLDQMLVYKVIGSHEDKALFVRQEKNVGLLEGHLANVLREVGEGRGL